jgi:plasmid stabilization system protein ParE
MTYEVVWTPSAERDLAAVWVTAPDQRAVTEASHRLEQALRRAPISAGESRSSSVHRVVYDPPLGFTFLVIEDDKRVLVQAVWLVP